MGKTAIRTAGKVSLDKPASEQENLHVSDLVEWEASVLRAET